MTGSLRPTAGADRAVYRTNALPTDTSIRFLLLMAAVLAAVIYLADMAWLGLNGERWVTVVRECGGPLPSPGGSLAADAENLAEQSACRAPLERQQVAWELIAVLGTVALAWAVYLATPRWLEHRGRLTPLDPTDGADILAEVGERSATTGARPAPAVRVSVADSRIQGFVYGRTSRPRLALTGGLVTTRYASPPTWDAVLAHELAHLAAKDVRWAWFTRSVLVVFALLVTPASVAALIVTDPDQIVSLGSRLAVLIALVLVAAAALLRTRELLADSGAAGHGAGPALATLLEDERGGRRRLAWVASHPSNRRRLAVLSDPGLLSRADFPAAVVAGIATGSVFIMVAFSADLVLPGLWGPWAAAAVVAPLIATLLVVTSWRVRRLELDRGRPGPLVAPLGVGLGLGLVMGPLLSPATAAGLVVVTGEDASGYLIWSGIAIGVVLVVTRWVADLAYSWLDQPLGRRRPRLLAAVAGGMVTVVLVPTLGSLYLALLLLTNPSERADLGVWTWLLWTRGATFPVVPAVASAVVVAVVAGSVAWSAGQWWRWGKARAPVVASLLVGLGAAAAGLALRLLLAGGVAADVATTDGYRLAAGVAQLLVVVAAMIVAAACGAAMRPASLWPLAALDGALAGVLAAAGNLANAWAASCSLLPVHDPGACRPPTGAEVWTLVTQGLSPGLPGTLLAGAVVAGIRATFSRRSRLHTTGRRLVLAAVTGLVGAAAVLGVAVAAAVQVDRGGYGETVEVSGPGYTAVLPVLWQDRSDLLGDDQVGAYSPDTQDVTVLITPTEPGVLTAPPDAETLVVGGVTAPLVQRAASGPGREQLVFVAEHDETAHAIVVEGSPDSLATHWTEVESFAASIDWQ